MNLRAKITPQRLALLALVLVGLSYATMIENFSWNQTSHYALIRSLDNDTAIIDPFANTTGDKALYKGHYYSARAPGLAFFTLPFYDVLVDIHAPQWTLKHQALRNTDDMVWLITLWGAVLPGFVLLLLVWRMGEQFEPGYGVAAALALGLGTLILPLSTLLFSHVFTACLGFAAFMLVMRERAGPQALWKLGIAGLLIGYAIASEYPLFFVGFVVGIYMLGRRDTFRPTPLVMRTLVYCLGIAIGVIPLLLYNHLAFGSYTHIAYADVPRQKAGFFGIGTPRFAVLMTLLFDSRGLFTLAPVLIMGFVGIVLMYRRGHRGEAVAIAGVAACYLTYNSGYYLPFGGGIMGPRFLTTMLPFVSMPLVFAVKRFPAPTIALAAISVTTMAIPTMTHPLVGYETETVTWMRYLDVGNFQPTIFSLYGAGRGWFAISPFVVLVMLAVLFTGAAMSRVSIDLRGLIAGLATIFAWAVCAAIVPTKAGLDHAGLVDILHAGDMTALHKPWPDYPLTHLVVVATIIGLCVLGLAALLRNTNWPPTASPRRAPAPPEHAPAVGV